MHRTLLTVSLAALLLTGCSRETPAPNARDVVPVVDRLPEVTPVLQPAVAVVDDARPLQALVNKYAEPTAQDRYDAAILQAIDLLADKKYDQAMNFLETARSIQDSDQVRREIDKVKALVAEQDAAAKTVRDIQTVLNDGKAEDASRLTTAALQQFGGSDVADNLAQLKRQADAVALLPLDDKQARRDRFLREAQAARQDQNLRAAALAYEQVLQAGEDADLRRQYDELRGTLGRYDENRQRAAQLRRDPTQLEAALAALEEARKAWDTPQVRMDIDEYTFALQKRRDRLSVADFEVRGDVGLAQAGKTVAEELLPAFKSRFDLVEREHLGRVIDELKLEASALGDDPSCRKEVGQLARIRYLVVGSLTPLCGVTANARLVDVQTGLVVQTARVSAPTVEALIPKLPLLAQLLTMSDDQKLAFEAALAEKAAVEAIKPIEPAPLPPPPEFVQSAPPPPPLVTYTAAPPVLGGLTIEDFQRLPVVEIVDTPPPAVELVLTRKDPRCRRMVQLSLELGDNLFRRGRFREAQRHFSLALSFSSNHAEIDLRLERCRPHLPPPPPPAVVVVAPPPVRPRLVVFSFLVNSDPGLVPPAIGDWATDQMAGYFGPSYDIIERGEVCWYMGRLGITYRDVVCDPAARVCLAQALNARYFVYGSIVQTHSFDVTTHLIDAQSGARTGTGTIHVQDHQELKLRMQELAQQLGAPKQQAQLAQQGRDGEKALNEARSLQKAGQYAQAADVARTALKTNPNSVALQTLVSQSEQQARQADLETVRKRGAERQRAEVEAARQKQQELARQAEAARLKADQDAKARGEAARKADEDRKQAAYQQLRAEGQKAMQERDYARAVGAFRSATALVPSDAGLKDLAQAQAKLNEAARQRAAAEQVQKQVEDKKARDLAQARVEDEKKKRAAEDEVKRKAQEARDQAEYARLITASRQSLSKQRYDEALTAAQSARVLKQTDEVEKLLTQVRQEQAVAEAARKSAAARADAEHRVAEDNARAAQAQAEAKAKQDAYTRALNSAQAALSEKRYDQAIAQFQEAGKLYKTEAVLAGVKQAQELRDREASKQAQADAQARQRHADYDVAMGAGRTALINKNYPGAVSSFSEALRIIPGDRAATDALDNARRLDEAARKAAADAARAAQDQRQHDADYAAALTAGRAALAAKKYDDALRSFNEASRLKPGDREALAWARQAEDGKAAAVLDAKRHDDFNSLVAQGQVAMVGKKYAAAVKAYGDALKLQPGDPTATRGFNDATAALNPPKPPPPPAPPPPPNPQVEYNKHMQTGTALDQQKRYAEAITAYTEALREVPNDARASAALKTATYNYHMTEGQKLSQAKRFADAAKQYEEALKLFPKNADAEAALKRAREGKP
jgi:tetratricopeptide (TPR) repeat protein